MKNIIPEIIIYILSILSLHCSSAISEYTDAKYIAPIPPPENTIFYINNNDNITYQYNLNFTIDITDATLMRFQENKKEWSEWEAYSESKIWSVTGNSNSSIQINAEFQHISGRIIELSDEIFFIDKIFPGEMPLFGEEFAVSNDGTIIAAVSINDNKLYIYKWNNNKKQWKSTIINENALAPNINYGNSIDITGDGTLIAVGIPDAQNFKSSGMVYIYNISDMTNISKQIIEPQNPDNILPDQKFGKKVSFANNGSFIAIGAPGFNNNCGKVYIYANNANTWSKFTEILPGINNANLYFGSVIDSSNNFNTLTITQKELNNEKVFIYSFDPQLNPFSSLIKTLEPDQTEVSFGYSISLSGDGETLAVGHHLAAVPLNSNNQKGKLYIYNINDNWTKKQIIIDDTLSNDAFFGSSIDLNYEGTKFLVGAYNNNTIISNYGLVKEYEIINGLWLENKIFDITDANLFNQFGFKVMYSNNQNKIFISSPKDISGSIYIFDN